MLAAFKAQQIYELKQRDKSKIESLLAYGDRLLVGLSTGALRIFRVNEITPSEEPNGSSDHVLPPSPTKHKTIELLRDEVKFGKKPVQQLAIVKEVQLLVSLSDGYVSFHDLQEYNLVERLEITKGATCFTVTSNVVKDSETTVPTLVSRLAVAVKRKVLCWTWQDMEQFSDAAEIALESTVKSLTWVTGTKLVVGMDPGYAIVDVETQEQTPVNRPVSRMADNNSAEVASMRFGAVSSSGMGYMGMGSWVPKPLCTCLADEQVLLARDVNSLFIDINANPLEKRQVPWSLAPEAIGYSYPYLLALQPPEKGSLQIRNPDSLSLLQAISVPNASLLHVPQPNISLAHAGKGFLVASERTIWRMNALPYDDQLNNLIEHERFDEAISLLRLLEDTLIDNKERRIREVQMKKATRLFLERDYRASMDLFTDAEAPPDRVIRLYPKSVAGQISTVPDEADKEDKDGAPENDDTNSIAEPVKEPSSTPSKGLLGRVTGSHARKPSEPEASKSPLPPATPTSTPHKRTVSKPPLEGKVLEAEDLKLATRCLTSFLAQARVKIGRYLNPDGTLQEEPPVMDSETGRPAFANLLSQSVFENDNRDVNWQMELLGTARLVYTTLFRSYMLASPSLASSLFRIDNFCDPEVVQSSLYESQRYGDLIDFLHGKRLHRQALEMLVKFGKDEAEGEVPEVMHGSGQTVAYLKQLPPEQIDLILEFVKWPLQTAPDVGMDVFIADTDNAEKLPRDKVVEFLAGIDVNLEKCYLEHIVNDLGDKTPDFHQSLVDLYLSDTKDMTTETSVRTAAKEKLETFLHASKFYNKSKTFRQLPTDDPSFYESRALVLGAMGNHKQVLAIYVFQLQDYPKAESYCTKIYTSEENQAEEATTQRPPLATYPSTSSKPPLNRSTTEVSKSHPNIFAILLSLYLNPPTPEPTRWPQALSLLSRHGARLPASSTLENMPSDLPVAELQDYFRGRLRHATSVARQERVVRSLEETRAARAEYKLLTGGDEAKGSGWRGKDGRVRIGEEDCCGVCHRRFGASAVRVWPGGVVVHYGCVLPKKG